MDKKILAVITARKGSKGLPGKNTKFLGGKPLISYTAEVAKKSKLITHLIVSTDDEEAARICREAGVEVPFMRPDELSLDTTPHLPVMQHAIQFMENKLGIVFDYVVILQPTSPFRTVEDIDETLEKLISTGADSAVTLVEVSPNEHPIKIKKIIDDVVVPYSVEEKEGMRRQEFPVAYKRSGAVYAMRRDLFMKDNRLYGDKVVGHIVPKERSVDIDYLVDWVVAEYMFNRFQVND